MLGCYYAWVDPQHQPAARGNNVACRSAAAQDNFDCTQGLSADCWITAA